VRANEESFNPWAETYFCEHNPATDFVARLLIGASDYSGWTPNPGGSRDYGPDADIMFYFKGMIDDIRVYDRELSEEEIMYAAGLSEQNYYGIVPPAAYANLSDEEPQGSKVVNFRDLAVLAADWMESDLWPPGF
jgi:hypothetical protein